MGKLAGLRIKGEPSLNLIIDHFFFFFWAWEIYFSVSLTVKQKCFKLNFPEADHETRIPVKVMYQEVFSGETSGTGKGREEGLLKSNVNPTPLGHSGSLPQR